MEINLVIFKIYKWLCDFWTWESNSKFKSRNTDKEPTMFINDYRLDFSEHFFATTTQRFGW